ncbi:MAG: hypothetical protein LC126_07500 [Bryobacterales bacterium]|nr:hypothetical protein [Bryobacterales bacterium]
MSSRAGGGRTHPAGEVEIEAHEAAEVERWKFPGGLSEGERPVFLRGDSHWGAENILLGAEQRGLGYMYKLKQSAKVKKLIGRLFDKAGWEDAGQQWEGRGDQLQLSGWSTARRMVAVLRRVHRNKEAGQATGEGKGRITPGRRHGEGRKSGKQLTLDRGDSKNNFDELKNQWGWAGFTAQDRKRCQLMGRISALVYNRRTIFMRLGIPDKHAEGRRIAVVLTKVSGLLKRIEATAEQLTESEHWKWIRSAAFRNFLGGALLGSVGRIADARG